MYCKSCGKIVDSDSKFCMHCGVKLFSNDKIIPEVEMPINSLSFSKKEIEPENKFKTTPLINPFQKEKVENTTQNKTHVLEEFEVKEKERILSPKDIFGYLFCTVGSFLLSWVMAFSILNEHPMNENYTVGTGPFSLEKYSQLFYSILFLLIGSFLSGSNRIIFKKIISITIDGIILFIWTALCVGIFLGNSSINDTFIFNYELILNEFTTRIVAWSLFFLLYYLLGELTGGTLGKKIVGLTSLDFQKNRISLKQSFQKTLIYSASIWIILLWFIWNHYLININDSIFFHFCQWLCFALLFASLIMIFISKEHHSLADIFSKTIVTKRLNNSWVSELILGGPLNIVEQNFQSTPKTNYSNNNINNLLALHKLIDKEKKRIFSTQNETIINFIKETITDKNSFFQVNGAYKKQYSTDLLKDLVSISSSYGTIYFYVEPFIKLGVCEDEYPHRIIPIEL